MVYLWIRNNISNIWIWWEGNIICFPTIERWLYCTFAVNNSLKIQLLFKVPFSYCWKINTHTIRNFYSHPPISWNKNKCYSGKVSCSYKRLLRTSCKRCKHFIVVTIATCTFGRLNKSRLIVVVIDEGLLTLLKHLGSPRFSVESVFLILWVFCVVFLFRLSSSCVLCTQCCQCLWIVFVMCLVYSVLPVSLDCPFLSCPFGFL